MSPELRRRIQEVIKSLGDNGKIMEAGWTVFRQAVVSPTVTTIQVDEMKLSFYAGASYIFDSIFHSMDPGNEPTAADERRMEKLHQELQEFEKNFRKERLG